MVRPVNKTILVELIDQETYKKTKTGLIIPQAGIMDTSGRASANPKPKIKVLDKSADCTIAVSEGEFLECLDSHIVYFYDDAIDPDNVTKLALIREDRVIGVWPKE